MLAQLRTASRQTLRRTYATAPGPGSTGASPAAKAQAAQAAAGGGNSTNIMLGVAGVAAVVGYFWAYGGEDPKKAPAGGQ
ncbi:hypothetical protein JCM8097_005058 [Rhodosporidiobolus ruineniae]